MRGAPPSEKVGNTASSASSPADLNSRGCDAGDDAGERRRQRFAKNGSRPGDEHGALDSLFRLAHGIRESSSIVGGDVRARSAPEADPGARGAPGRAQASQPPPPVRPLISPPTTSADPVEVQCLLTGYKDGSLSVPSLPAAGSAAEQARNAYFRERDLLRSLVRVGRLDELGHAVRNGNWVGLACPAT
jgi:hypothetical protein